MIKGLEENLYRTIDTIMNFKNQKEFKNKYLTIEDAKKILENIPKNNMKINDVENEFKRIYLPYCTNDSSVNNMGFPDCGNDSASIMGALYSELLQQNLINQSGSSPSLTFAEINVIRWLREVVGYENKDEVNNIFDVGGIVTYGGTMSNTVAMMLARENHKKNTMLDGVCVPTDFKVLIPENISHYSIKSSLMWIGLGNNIVEIKVKNFKMDQNDLQDKLNLYKSKIMACVVYAGDSRSMTIDDLQTVYSIIKKFDPNIWLHVDACHGFSLGFSDKLKSKIAGINNYDSITTDAHKVLMVPYGLSVLLTKETNDFKLIMSESDLIMKEDYAFGQITPFIGSKNATSLKLWFFIKHHGKRGIGDIIERRHKMAKLFKEKLLNEGCFIVLNEVEINSVMFLLIPSSIKEFDLYEINQFNRNLYNHIQEEGIYYLHNFPIKIAENKYDYDDYFYPLRYMSGNDMLSEKDLNDLVIYLKSKRK